MITEVVFIESQDDGRICPSYWYQVTINRNDPVFFRQSELAEAIAYAKKRAKKVVVNGDEVIE
jgi:hypothetical protein|tara:strand:- start:48 stop:236 length:189 start_codon:yes stop_codon:yes gene_type:complete